MKQREIFAASVSGASSVQEIQYLAVSCASISDPQHRKYFGSGDRRKDGGSCSRSTQNTWSKARVCCFRLKASIGEACSEVEQVLSGLRMRREDTFCAS
jgi:hypothetical protein